MITPEYILSIKGPRDISGPIAQPCTNRHCRVRE